MPMWGPCFFWQRVWQKECFRPGAKKKPRTAGLFPLLAELFPASDFLQAVADVGEAANGFDTGRFQGLELLVCRAFTTGDDGASVAHALASRCGNTGDVRHNWLGDVFLDVGCGFILSAAAAFADQHDRFGLRIFLEQFQDVDEVRAWDRVAADADAG